MPDLGDIADITDIVDFSKLNSVPDWGKPDATDRAQSKMLGVYGSISMGIGILQGIKDRETRRNAARAIGDFLRTLEPGEVAKVRVTANLDGRVSVIRIQSADSPVYRDPLERFSDVYDITRPPWEEWSNLNESKSAAQRWMKDITPEQRKWLEDLRDWQRKPGPKADTPPPPPPNLPPIPFYWNYMVMPVVPPLAPAPVTEPSIPPFRRGGGGRVGREDM